MNEGKWGGGGEGDLSDEFSVTVFLVCPLRFSLVHLLFTIVLEA